MEIDIEYNSSKESIAYPEYGRYIHELLEHACSIEDDYRRQKTAETIVGMMQLLNPNNRGVEDYKERLWNHAFAITDYKLNVKAPPAITIRPEGVKVVPEPIEYPQPIMRFRHYGASIQKLVAKAIEMPDGPKKEGLVEVIASYMKLAYKTWNREHYVSDDIVKEDLVLLSEGRLELHEGHNSLDTLTLNAHKQGLRDTQKQPKTKAKRSSSSSRKPKSSSGNSNSAAGGFRKRKR